jgi:hypothetical protein
MLPGPDFSGVTVVVVFGLGVVGRGLGVVVEVVDVLVVGSVMGFCVVSSSVGP